MGPVFGKLLHEFEGLFIGLRLHALAVEIQGKTDIAHPGELFGTPTFKVFTTAEGV